MAEIERPTGDDPDGTNAGAASTNTEARSSGGAKVGDGLAYAGGIGLILLGLLWLTTETKTPPLAHFAMGLMFLLPGVLMLPVTIGLLRRRFSSLAGGLPHALLVLGAFGAMFTLAVAGGPRAAGQPATPTPPPPSSAAKAVTPDAPIPSNLDRSTMILQAKAELRAGHTERAMAIIYGNAPMEMLRTDREVRALIDEITAHMSTQVVPGQAEDFVDHVRSTYIPEVRELSQTPPADADTLWAIVDKLDEEARHIDEGDKLPPDPKVRQAVAELHAAMAAKQRVLFPILRRAYGDIMSRGLWKNDVAVRVSGPGYRALTWTAEMFAAHANIATAQEGAYERLMQARFTSSSYRWADGVGEVNIYRMKSPTDDAVGYWEGATFVPVR